MLTRCEASREGRECEECGFGSGEGEEGGGRETGGDGSEDGVDDDETPDGE